MKCIIIEDQPPAQRILKKYISDYGSLDLVGTFTDALQALDFLKTNDVNLLAEYFNNAQLPKELKIDSYTIKNVKSFIDENIKIIKSYSDWDRKPFLKRLYYIKEIVKKYNLKYVA